MRVPQYQPQVAPQGSPGVELTRSAPDFGEAQGVARARAGAQLTSTALQVKGQQDAERAQLKAIADQTRLTDSVGKLETWRLEALHNPKTGAMLRRGEAALGLPDEVFPQFQQHRGTIEEGLPEDLRGRFRMLADDLERDIRKEVYGKVAKEGDQLAIDVENATDTTALATISAVADQPELVQDAFTRWLTGKRSRMETRGVPAAVIDATELEIGAKVNGIVLDRRMIDVRDSIPGLQLLERELDEGTGFAANLDPNKRNQLLANAQGNIVRLRQHQEMLAARAERERQVRIENAGRAFSEMRDLMLTGTALAPEYIEEVAAKTTGTPYAEVVTQLFDEHAAIGGFASRGLAEQQATLDAFDEKIATDGNTPELERHRKTLGTVHEATKREVGTDPLGAALQRGVIDAVEPLDLTDPGRLAESLLARRQTTDVVENWTGAPIPPLRPHEVAALKERLSKATTDGKLGLFAAIRNGTDAPAYMRAMAQLAGDRPELAGFGAMAAANARTTEGRSVAALGLDGLALLQEKTFPLPKDTGGGGDAMVPVFNDAVGVGAFLDSTQRETAYSMARAVYAKLSHEAGDTTGVLDAELFKRSVRLITGGLYEHAGSKVIPPYGMPEDEFQAALDARLRAAADAAGVPVARLRDLPLVPSPRAAGVYYLSTGRDVLRRGARDVPLPKDGLVVPGNINLNARPLVRNADGTISTVRSISISEDGKEILLPTVSADGAMVLSDEAAIAQYRETGQHLGIFRSPQAATAYAKALHEREAERINANAPLEIDVNGYAPPPRQRRPTKLDAR